mmetsp:Transcript_803/g.1668  ORF Transcript_803/g.1668 Transcript_803/m.1668 type:complete len:215 (-) Transcript_803:1365-2009(-)
MGGRFVGQNDLQDGEPRELDVQVVVPEQLVHDLQPVLADEHVLGGGVAVHQLVRHHAGVVDDVLVDVVQGAGQQVEGVVHVEEEVLHQAVERDVAPVRGAVRVGPRGREAGGDRADAGRYGASAGRSVIAVDAGHGVQVHVVQVQVAVRVQVQVVLEVVLVGGVLVVRLAPVHTLRFALGVRGGGGGDAAAPTAPAGGGAGGRFCGMGAGLLGV